MMMRLVVVAVLLLVMAGLRFREPKTEIKYELIALLAHNIYYAS